MSGALTDIGDAIQAGEKLAKDLVQIAQQVDLGDIREDATSERLARMLQEVPKEYWGVVLSETVKFLAIGLSVFIDTSVGRDPMRPTIGPPADL